MKLRKFRRKKFEKVIDLDVTLTLTPKKGCTPKPTPPERIIRSGPFFTGIHTRLVVTKVRIVFVEFFLSFSRFCSSNLKNYVF